VSAQKTLSFSQVQGVDPSICGKNRVKKADSPVRDDAEMLLGVEMIVNTLAIQGSCTKMIEVLTAIEKNGGYEIDEKKYGATNQVIKNVFPRTDADTQSPCGADGWKGEVWCLPGKEGTVGKPYKETKTEGRVGLVLGAGNQGVLSITDMLDMMFVHHTVCVVKHHPLRNYNKPFFQKVFAPLIEGGFLADVCGDIPTGSYIINSKYVSKVHMTGGTPTHDAIVWGIGKEIQAANKAAMTPVLEKEMTSELGCVTPWIITPAADGHNWTDDELMHHAKQLFVATTSNNSCNCLSAKVLVIPEGWSQEEDFLQKFKLCLASKPALPAYYPGTQQRYAAFEAAYPEFKKEYVTFRNYSADPSDKDVVSNEFNAGMKRLPMLLVNADPVDGEYALQNEAFSPVLAIVRLPVETEKMQSHAEAFLEQAVDFCNDKIWGSLSMSIIAHPTLTPEGTSEDADVVRKAVSRLRYGTVAINSWAARSFQLEALPWGAFPGEKLENVRSGIGFVRNSYMVDHPEKAVLWTPFMSNEHLGNDVQAMTVHKAEGICKFLTRGGLWNLFAMICYPGCLCLCNDPTGVARSKYSNGQLVE